ncbi:hypothetical protein [Micromonospora maritima]|uniref:hypothetical protein n=1 Tax=Micromonospora maritima TaxID=986711 RepID=UPI00157BE858|nr:hypothetical protein [Micromonospora maritima]
MLDTAEQAMAMPHGNAGDAHADDHRSSDVVIKASGEVTKRGNASQAVAEQVRQAWLFALAPTPVHKLLDRVRNPSVPGDNALLKALYRVFMAVVALPLTLLFYGLAAAQQNPARAVVVDGALVGLAAVWLA